MSRVTNIIRELEMNKVIYSSLSGDTIAIQKYFDTKFNGLSPIILEDYPNSVFYVRDNYNVYFELNKKTSAIYYSYSGIWSPLISVFGLNEQEIMDILGYMTKNYFNTNGVYIILNSQSRSSWTYIHSREIQ